MKKEPVKQLKQELREIKRRLRSVERQVNRLEAKGELSAKEEFKRAFPNMQIDPKWFKIVGSLPPSSVAEDEYELTQKLEEIYHE